MPQDETEPFNFLAEVTWHLENLPNLEREYWGQYILIVGRRVHFASTSLEAALEEGKKRFGHQFFVPRKIGSPPPPLGQITD